VPRFSAKSFEQAAGFMRVPGAPHPLDNTGVHPERYALLEGLATRLGKSVAELLGPGAELVRQAAELREEVGAFTFDDIVKELEKPGRDPRDTFVPRSGTTHELQDLKPGMVCPALSPTHHFGVRRRGRPPDGPSTSPDGRAARGPAPCLEPRRPREAARLRTSLKQISLTMKVAAGEAPAAAGKGAPGGTRKPRSKAAWRPARAPGRPPSLRRLRPIPRHV
jgi:uncharacterized protein